MGCVYLFVVYKVTEYISVSGSWSLMVCHYLKLLCKHLNVFYIFDVLIT